LKAIKIENRRQHKKNRKCYWFTFCHLQHSGPSITSHLLDARMKKR
jgi:hypothetical protein